MDKLTEGYGLIEGPVWDESQGLIFSDVLLGGVYLLDKSGGVSSVFEHRRGIGGMAMHEAGGLIVTGRNVSYKPFDGGETKLILDRNPDANNVGYNDLTTDRLGRIYVGSLGSSPVFDDGLGPTPGDLYFIDTDGSSKIVAKDILLTNGLAFSPDGSVLYHSDSSRKLINCYAVSESGDLGRKQEFAVVANGVPDGLVVSEDGRVWVALAGGGHGVAVFEPGGRETEMIKIPQPMCTSVCFGGENMESLFIVSGSDGSNSKTAGAIYKIDVGVAGCPVIPAKIDLPD